LSAGVLNESSETDRAGMFSRFPPEAYFHAISNDWKKSCTGFPTVGKTFLQRRVWQHGRRRAAAARWIYLYYALAKCVALKERAAVTAKQMSGLREKTTGHLRVKIIL
jgi:hypothetical protein